MPRMPRDRIVSGESAGVEEQRVNYALRPTTFDGYVGQQQLIRKLRIAVTAAKGRDEPVDHSLFHGPPGLGKTTLAHVIANEIGTRVHVTTGPALTKPADLAGILSNLDERDVLFVDEIHRTNTVVEEYLYSAMEDFKIDMTLDAGAHARGHHDAGSAVHAGGGDDAGGDADGPRCAGGSGSSSISTTTGRRICRRF